MGYEIQSTLEWMNEQVNYPWGNKRKTMSYEGFQFIVTFREMMEIYDRCEGDYHSVENTP